MSINKESSRFNSHVFLAEILFHTHDFLHLLGYDLSKGDVANFEVRFGVVCKYICLFKGQDKSLYAPGIYKTRLHES